MRRDLKGDAAKIYLSAYPGGRMKTALMRASNARANQDKLASNHRKTCLSTRLKKSS